MAETTTDDFPQDWEALTRQDMMAGIPQLVLPHELTVTQSALLSVFSQRWDERIETLTKLGFFKKAKASDPMGVVTAIAEAVDYANAYFRTLADPEQWDEWTKGRELADMFVMFATLSRFYREQLGKSNASRKPSMNAA